MVDEVSYILLKQKAQELLDEDRHYKNQMPELEMFSSVIKKYLLFPRDATHLSLMQSLNISDIVTTDSDFDKIREITVWNP